MKKLKLKRYALVVLGILVTALLFIFGHNGHDATGVAMATATAVSLTPEEKEGFSEQEQKVLSAMKKMVNQLYEDARKGLITDAVLKQALADMKDGLSKDEIKSLKDEIKKLEDAAKEQGKVLANLKEFAAPDEVLSFEKAYEDNLKELQRIREAGTGFKTFYFGDYDPKKVTGDEDASAEKQSKNYITGIKTLFRAKSAGITSIGNSTASSPSSVTNPYSPFPQQLPEIVAVRRNPNFALNYVDVGSTNSAVLTWTEEGNSEGDAAVIAEGAAKPLQDKKFIDRISKAKKIAGHIVITEEMEVDTPRLATAVRRLFEQNVMRKYDDQVYADIIAVAPGYTLTALDNQIDNADNYAAIGAAIAQVESLNGMVDLIAINPADKWNMRLQKGSDGHYVAPPFTVGNNTYDGIKVVVTNKVAAGNFLVGEAKTYKVDEYKSYSLRIGWQNDDLVKNQFTAVGEVRFHSYIATNDLVAWCYASFDTVKQAIEKP